MLTEKYDNSNDAVHPLSARRTTNRQSVDAETTITVTFLAFSTQIDRLLQQYGSIVPIPPGIGIVRINRTKLGRERAQTS